jgi:uncharacterized protein (TIGR02271 family)
MTTSQQWENMIGLTATDTDGDKIGKVGQVYLDEGTGQPEWVTVSTGMFGTRQSFAPLYGSSVRDDQLVLAVSRELVKDAPSIEDYGRLEEAEVTALYQHYAANLPVSHEEVRLEREPTTGANRDAAVSGADITEAEHEVQLNAERPVVTKETVPVERVRLATESVAGEEHVSEEVRKEQIDKPEVDTGRGRER